MFTDKQKELIQKCKYTGYGWKKFAISIENQGFCSNRQEQVLTDMVERIKTIQESINKPIKRKKVDCYSCYEDCITSDEIMSFGEYI